MGGDIPPFLLYTVLSCLNNGVTIENSQFLMLLIKGEHLWLGLSIISVE
jgi:hypothetical protein